MNDIGYGLGLALSVFTSAANQSETVKYVDFDIVKESGIKTFGQSHFGISGEIPKSKSINFYAVLENKWLKKLKVKGIKPSVKKSYKIVLDSYITSDKGYTTLKELMFKISNDIIMVKETIDYDSICLKLKLNFSQCELFKDNVKLVDDKVLMSYGLTELFPYRDGTKSAANMDLLLRTAGEKYINSIPAMGDGYLSFGLYQFTSYAAGRDSSGPRPTNLISDFSAYKIPDSVIKFDSQDHHRAALYFSVYNLALLFKKLSHKEQIKFILHCYNDKLAITQFIATAHHQPSTAIKGAKKWINDDCKENYKYYQNKALNIYAAKTETNYKAIESI